LLGLQNRDGGWPTFCRGWGKLPFDRSGADLTAHALRALWAWRPFFADFWDEAPFDRAIARGIDYLRSCQRPDGSWVPLWFGNQHAPNEENPTYGTARVLAAYRDLNLVDSPDASRGIAWLGTAQNSDGGWGGAPGIPSSVEETALAVEALATPGIAGERLEAVKRGAAWLVGRVQSGEWKKPSPIGFYFAKLWYFEKLYPQIFTAAALGRAFQVLATQSSPTSTHAH
jgi:squalene-hopene/tetraprenyl-beta-curcumene cyclase